MSGSETGGGPCGGGGGAAGYEASPGQSNSSLTY